TFKDFDHSFPGIAVDFSEAQLQGFREAVSEYFRCNLADLPAFSKYVRTCSVHFKRGITKRASKASTTKSGKRQFKKLMKSLLYIKDLDEFRRVEQRIRTEYPAVTSYVNWYCRSTKGKPARGAYLFPALRDPSFDVSHIADNTNSPENLGRHYRTALGSRILPLYAAIEQTYRYIQQHEREVEGELSGNHSRDGMRLTLENAEVEKQEHCKPKLSLPSYKNDGEPPVSDWSDDGDDDDEHSDESERDNEDELDGEEERNDGTALDVDDGWFADVADACDTQSAHEAWQMEPLDDGVYLSTDKEATIEEEKQANSSKERGGSAVETQSGTKAPTVGHTMDSESSSIATVGSNPKRSTPRPRRVRAKQSVEEGEEYFLRSRTRVISNDTGRRPIPLSKASGTSPSIDGAIDGSGEDEPERKPTPGPWTVEASAEGPERSLDVPRSSTEATRREDTSLEPESEAEPMSSDLGTFAVPWNFKYKAMHPFDTEIDLPYDVDVLNTYPLDAVFMALFLHRHFGNWSLPHAFSSTDTGLTFERVMKYLDQGLPCVLPTPAAANKPYDQMARWIWLRQELK
ncbi:hypothetical protein BGZ73_000630, partial [Actinomortierella ambigua]